MQKSDNHLYREQRRIPKNISPQDTDNHAGKLKLIEAPRAHEMTRRYMHDCEYAGVNEIRAGLREATRLKKNLYGHVIPFKSETINAPSLLPKTEATPRPDNGKGKAALRASPYNADQGPSTRRRLDPPRSAPQNRYADLDTVYSGDPAKDRATHSGPMADRNSRDKYDNSLRDLHRDRSMGSERSRDSRPRETETTGPNRSRDPPRWDAHQDRSRPANVRTRSPIRDRGGKGKGPRAATSSPALPFPAFFPQTISITPLVYALRHLNLVQEVLPPPTESEARDISDQDLADLLRKTSLGPHDRANHEMIC